MGKRPSNIFEDDAVFPGPLALDDVHKSYTAICRALDHEAKVSSDRITWAVSLTGGLFAASTILITIIVLGKPPAQTIGVLLSFMAGIAFVGVLTSSIAMAGVIAAYRQFSYLRQRYKDQEGVFKNLRLPRPTGDDSAHWWAKLVAAAFPSVLIVCWSFDLLIAGALGTCILTDLQIDRVYKLWPALKGGEAVIEPSFLQYLDTI